MRGGAGMKWFVAGVRAGAVGVLVVALAACRATPDEVIAEHRAAVEQTFARLAALHAAAVAAPPVTEDRIDAGGAAIVLDGADTNALYLLAEHLRAPGQGADIDDVPLLQLRAYQCGEALSRPTHYAADALASLLPSCADAEYVFVQRTHDFVPAALVGETTFAPGHYTGDVLLYRVADGALLGGFRVAAESSDSISVGADESGRALDPIGGVNQDLARRVQEDITAKLKQHVPGVVPY